jgi:hypothetical protein
MSIVREEGRAGGKEGKGRTNLTSFPIHDSYTIFEIQLKV